MRKQYLMKLSSRLKLLGILMCVSLGTNAQLSGTLSIPTDYPSLSAFVNALNVSGVGPGGVTLNIPAGYVENLTTRIDITAQGTVTDQIIIQKSGTGANPQFIAYTGANTPSSATRDGMLSLTGADYVTINGLSFSESPSNTTATTQMEYAIGLFKSNATNGAQNNSILNCEITLDRSNNATWTGTGHNGSCGIVVLNCTPTANTAVTVTAATGANSFNKIYGNTIQNCNAGIVFAGFAATTPFTLGDQLNDVGGTSIVTGNTILNFGGATAATNPATGIFANNQWGGFNCSFNTVNNNNGNGINHVSTLRGIFLNSSSAGASASINNNIISVHGGGTTSQVTGIENAFGSAAGGAISILNNTITGSYITATSGAWYGIYNTSAAPTINIIGNSISNVNYGSLSTTSTGALYPIWSSSGTTVNVRSNVVNNINRVGTTGGTTIGIYISGGTTQNVKLNSISNMSIDGTGSSSTMYGIQTTGTTVVVDSNTVNNLQCIKPTGTSTMYGIYNIASPTNENYNYNTVSNLIHNGTGTVYGIYAFTTTGVRTVSFNTVFNLTTSGTTISALQFSSSSPSIFRNKIYNVTSLNSGIPIVSGIRLGSVGTAGTANIFNNYIGNLNAPNANSTTTPTINGINLGVTTTSSNLFVSYNTIYLNAQSTGANFFTTGIFHTTSTTATNGNLTLRNNLIVNNSTPAGSGVSAAFARSSSALNNYNSLSNNNAFYAGSPGPYNVVYWDPTQTKISLSDYQAFTLTQAAGADSNSVTDNTPFLSTAGSDPTYLHVNPTVVNNVESTGVSIATISTDFDGDIRQGSAGYVGNGLAPDIGADEFAGIVITCPQPTGLSLQDATQTSATFTWTPGGIETQWQIEYGPQGFTQGTGTVAIVNTNPATISGLTANSFYSVYVRGICAPGDTAYFWTGPLTFNTYNQGQFMEWDNACPTTNFVDISGTGTLLTIGDDDEAAVQLPFGVLYQNNFYTNATLGNDGALILGTTTAQVGFSNTAITNATATGLYPLWDDWGSAGNGIWIDTVGIAPNRQFIVQWNKEHGSVTGGLANFELIIDEASQEIYYVYQDVITGNVTYDNGATATIGIAGPNQDLQVSFNNATYLTNNSCAHFYYTDCPKPSTFALQYVFPDEAAFTWSAGLANETNWTVIYGPDGFDPATSGTAINTTVASAVLPNLTQNTQYDVYVYADCSPILQSTGLAGTFLTPPFCSNPTNMINTSAVDSIFSSWSWTAYNANYPVTSFNIVYGQPGYNPYTGGTEITVDNNLTDTIVDASLLASGVYQLYVQAVCGQDTSTYVGPFTVTMALSNDSVCGAQMLPVDGVSYVFNNTGATVTPGENTIAPPATGAQSTTGWINSTLNNTLWYTFIAPASGNVRVNNTTINYAGQAAVYTTSGCFDYGLFSLNSANDNAIGGTSVAPNWTVCGLTPGDTVYLLIDGSTATTGNFAISISAIDLNAGAANNVVEICSGDSVNLFNTINNYDNGGVWTAAIPAAGTGIYNDTMFASAGLAYQVFNFEYRLTDGCAYDSIVGQVSIFRPSSAGNDGAITVCRNEPFDLLAGLSGNVDAGGTWYDPSNNGLPDSWLTAGNIPGQFNYDYITGNGICPNDTSNVLVTIDASCNYLEVNELAFEGVTIYPNPTNGVVFVSTSLKNISYEIVDVNGRIITTEINTSSPARHEINLGQHESGVYFIKAKNEEYQKVFRIVLN